MYKESNQNSLDRSTQRNLSIRSETVDRSMLGAIYTPPYVAAWVADLAARTWINVNGPLKHLQKLKVLDPACGTGELLSALSDKFSSLVSNRRRQVAELHGIDIDKDAIKKLKLLHPEKRIKAYAGNTILPSTNASAQDAIDNYKSLFAQKNGFDVVIANPPWGAFAGVDPAKLKNRGYMLAIDQFDISDLFFEFALKILKSDGIAAFIIPDSFFFPVRERLRNFLLTNSAIHYVIRLGEKIFPAVSRGCAIVIVQKTTSANKNHKLITGHLPASAKNAVISGKISIELAIAPTLSKITQTTIDRPNSESGLNSSRLSDRSLLERIYTRCSPLSEHVDTTRGIELSKSGFVVVCPNCNNSRPRPAKNEITCPSCGKSFIWRERDVITIVSNTKKRGYRSLIVGSDISRYDIKPSVWISTKTSGINYKIDNIFESPKILFRKTGIGINAAIDHSDALFNQVVYVLRPHKNCGISNEALLGILNSRLMNYCLAHLTGDVAWRSHPYVTQSHLRKLPLPRINQESKINQASVRAIDKAVRRLMSMKSNSARRQLDAIIEQHVAELYGLTKKEYKVIYSWLNKMEQLKVIRELTSISINEIF